MKAYVQVDQIKITEAIQEIKDVESVIPFSSEEAASLEEGSIILVSNDFADVKTMIQLRSNNPTAHMFYLISIYRDSAEAKTIQSMLKAHKVKVLPPYQTGKQIAQEIEGTLYTTAKKTSRVVNAMGSMYGVGLTTSLLALAKQMTEVSDIRIAVLGLNGSNPGTSCIEYKGKYLDEIWGLLDGRQLKPEDLEEKMYEIHPKLHYLAGNRDLLKTYTYTPEGISYLIELAKQRFDLVLLDIGYYIDTPLAVQGILSGDFILVYTNQRETAKESWFRMKEQILERELGMDIDNMKNIWMVCNMMYTTPDVETHTHLQEIYKLPCMATIQYFNSFYRFEVRKNFMEMNEKKYIQEINRVADALIDFYSFPLKAVVTNKSTGWRFLKGSRSVAAK